MTEKELKKLNRADLLEILVQQSREIDRLNACLEEAQAQLDSRKIELEEAGSIAEAAIRINKVFEAAQAAGQQYLDNIKRLAELREAECNQENKNCHRTDTVQQMTEKCSEDEA